MEDKVIKEPENNEDLALMQAQDWDQQIREQIEAEVAYKDEQLKLRRMMYEKGPFEIKFYLCI